MGKYHHIDTLSHPSFAPGSKKVRANSASKIPYFTMVCVLSVHALYQNTTIPLFAKDILHKSPLFFHGAFDNIKINKTKTFYKGLF